MINTGGLIAKRHYLWRKPVAGTEAYKRFLFFSEVLLSWSSMLRPVIHCGGRTCASGLTKPGRYSSLLSIRLITSRIRIASNRLNPLHNWIQQGTETKISTWSKVLIYVSNIPHFQITLQHYLSYPGSRGIFPSQSMLTLIKVWSSVLCPTFSQTELAAF